MRGGGRAGWQRAGGDWKCWLRATSSRPAGSPLLALLGLTRRPCRPPINRAEPSLKLLEEGDFMKAWGGIAGLQYALPATWHAWHQAELNLTRLAQVKGRRGQAVGHVGLASCPSPPA